MPVPAIDALGHVKDDRPPSMRGRDFLSVRDLSTTELIDTLGLAFRMKADPLRYCTSLRGRTLALLFEKPSLRTRVSFEVGIQQLGGYAIYLSPSDLGLGKRESIHDVAKTLERMVQGIMVRTFSHAIAEELARAARVPVINGLTDSDHPCQALADYMTIMELKGTLAGLKIAFVGDGNNVANSLIDGAARLGVRMALATPPGYEPRPDVLGWATNNAESGFECQVTNYPIDAVADADVVYTDVWTSMGQEVESDQRRRAFHAYQVNEALFARAKRNAVFMHCLPAHRGEEVTDEVIDSPRSVVFQQAENRLHAEKALLFELMHP